ncbi:class II fructose-bisphosphate aldolase [Alicyclobacillus fodiniaquatilis]|uniref:Ketose-bisphosphate aldolase n=1 Tax=Alicyclobacillus fodiniaquatilis TaxID=1661150 RepID=A0ABW4JIV6_9BACL
MPLVTTQKMYVDAMRDGYAVAGFAGYNLETLRALVQTAEELRAPVIVQTTPSNIENIGIDYLVEIVRLAAEKTSTPVALHLDHGDSLERVEQCVKRGFTSVMIDGSALPYNENLELAKEAVKIAHRFGVSVEAELGHVGGVEEELLPEGDHAFYTDPGLANSYVRDSGIDSLAVAIGTAHGLYQGEPHLDFERLAAIRSSVSVPLVLHGASGVPDNLIRNCIKYGISKINIATELKIPYANALRTFLQENPDEVDPRKYFKPGLHAYVDVVREKIRLVNAEGRY